MCKYNEGTGLGFGHDSWRLTTFVVGFVLFKSPTWLIMFGFACLTILCAAFWLFWHFEANNIVLYYRANVVMCSVYNIDS